MLDHRHSEIVVIGGGIIGLACAYYACRAGRQVCLIEKATVGGDDGGPPAATAVCRFLQPRNPPGVLRRRHIRGGYPKGPVWRRSFPFTGFTLYLLGATMGVT
jgi:glycine/D-amino acid oxidase-like deaminating enzyme